jgi:hypothetical protein
MVAVLVASERTRAETMAPVALDLPAVPSSRARAARRPLESGMRINRWQPPWWVVVLMVIAVFVLASRYILPLIRAVRELGGPDG